MQFETVGGAEAPGTSGRRSLWEDEGSRFGSPESTTIRLYVHLFCAACMGAFVIWGIVADPPVKGFFCNDTSIRYPLKEETVPANLATIIVIGVPVIIFVAVELLHAFVIDRSSLTSTQLMCFSVPKMLIDMYLVVGGFAFGLLVNFALANVAKLCIGRLRPHFLAVCQPNWNALQCTDMTGDLYINSYECRGTDLAAIKEARLSFFSAHSSNSSCAMIYTLIYLQYRLSTSYCGPLISSLRQRQRSNSKAKWAWDAATALRPFMQAVLLILCLFIALSRVMDFFHHPTDVLTGLFVGTVIAFYSAFYVSKLHLLGRF
ncbi:lipid phosphate phosphohydrolase 3, putative [Eimeria acervulina]|uniref:Lipid phosphate phosphohydrolase 3, putative n=1 Tax=Eimeria acervulina TaxID=5801 RepID=U6GXX0_EIMAC|nr:lipid phosphate phosphohydrolase 3, putative [Eimeria acervulina]CDI84467.1 lipid phosphate phosphohydrolase 3, putative [Eimeria acervulina]